MKNHAETLWTLVAELFTDNEQKRLKVLVTPNIPSVEAVIIYDESLGGPSITRLNCNNTGRYAVEDRDIFRPLQYCAMDFLKDKGADWEDDAEWLARDLVEMSSLHIESLIKNIGSVFHLPLGAALQKAVVKSKVDPMTWKQINTFTHIYNDAKHNFSHAKDTHMFSIEDALLSYFVCRKLGAKLYPLAKLATDMKIFEKECDEVEKARMSKWKVDPLDGEVDGVVESAGGWAIQ
jgi:hypothetical protein